MLHLQVGACYLQWNQKGWRFRDPEIISFWYTLKQLKIDGFDGLIFFLLRTRGMTGILGRGTTYFIISSLEGRWTMIISPWLVVFFSFFSGMKSYPLMPLLSKTDPYDKTSQCISNGKPTSLLRWFLVIQFMTRNEDFWSIGRWWVHRRFHIQP